MKECASARFCWLEPPVPSFVWWEIVQWDQLRSSNVCLWASLPKASGLKACPHPANVLLGLHQVIPQFKNGHFLSTVAPLSAFEAFGQSRPCLPHKEISLVCSYSSCTADKGFKLLHCCVSFLSNSTAFNQKKTNPEKPKNKPENPHQIMFCKGVFFIIRKIY